MKTFFPKKFVFIPASLPHAPNTEYKVSIGEEDWGGEHVTVIKVQMVYNGVVSGRKSPSYPVGTDDYSRVNKAIEKLARDHNVKV